MRHAAGIVGVTRVLAQSGRPSTRASFANSRSLAAATTSSPSCVGKASNTTSFGLPVRDRTGTTPVAAKAGEGHAHPAQRGLQQRGIDHRPPPGCGAAEQRRDAAQRRPDAGTRDRAPAPPRGRAAHPRSRSARTTRRRPAPSAHSQGRAASARWRRTPRASNRRASGCAARSVAAPKPARPARPGRRFWISTSASCSNACRRVAILRLLQVQRQNCACCGSRSGRPSPRRARKVAPSRARRHRRAARFSAHRPPASRGISAAYGPERFCAISITLMPASGSMAILPIRNRPGASRHPRQFRRACRPKRIAATPMVKTRSPSSRNFTFCSAISMDSPSDRHSPAIDHGRDHQRREPGGGFVITSSFGIAASALARPSILRWPPLSPARRLAPPLGQNRETGRTDRQCGGGRCGGPRTARPDRGFPRS